MFELLSFNALVRLFDGFLITLELAFISVCISLIGGLILGIIYSFKNPFISFFCRLALEFVRVMPLIVWLFVMYFGLSRWFGLNLSANSAAILVFSIWGVFEMMDLVKAALTSIAKHQYESGFSLALKPLQLYFYIILPQALRRLTPASINLLSRMIKSTTFAFLIGVIELVKVGQQIIELNHSKIYAPFIIYGLIFFIFFMLCYPLSLLASYLEKKWS